MELIFSLPRAFLSCRETVTKLHFLYRRNALDVLDWRVAQDGGVHETYRRGAGILGNIIYIDRQRNGNILIRLA